MTDNVQEVTIKGWRNGLLLGLPPGIEWGELLRQIAARLDEAKARSFWRGAQTTIDLADRPVTLADLKTLVEQLKDGHGLVPTAVVSTDEQTSAAAEKLVLIVYATLPVIKRPGDVAKEESGAEPAPSTESASPPVRAASQGSNALYVPGTVRSGQRIAHDGHIIVGGDVNAGAEVIAEGDILVFGTLRGLAHAGSHGNESARIVALSLRPPQLRIAGRIARSPEEEKSKGRAAENNRSAEVARIEAGEIQIFPL